MDFSLTEEQRLVQQMARDVAVREVEPQARSLDAESRFPTEIITKLGELGMMGICVPEQYGGAGADSVSYILALEELSRACASTGVIMSVNNSLACAPLLRFGTEAQKKRFLPGLASGKQLGCFGLTEPSSGSDASHMETVATPVSGGWRISGSKNWITNGPHADLMVVFAVTDRSLGAKGVSAFLVPTDSEGFVPQPRDEKLGIHAAHSCTIFFEDCFVPDEARLGSAGDGFKIAMASLDGGRLGIAAQALGIARAAYEKALAYCSERKAFGTLLREKQALRFMLADMATEIDAARLLVLRGAHAKDLGRRHTQESAVAKLFASEMCTRVTHRALQIYGGYGYSKEYDLERHYRDARITEIYEGTSEIMRLVIAISELKK